MGLTSPLFLAPGSLVDTQHDCHIILLLCPTFCFSDKNWTLVLCLVCRWHHGCGSKRPPLTDASINQLGYTCHHSICLRHWCACESLVVGVSCLFFSNRLSCANLVFESYTNLIHSCLPHPSLTVTSLWWSFPVLPLRLLGTLLPCLSVDYLSALPVSILLSFGVEASSDSVTVHVSLLWPPWLNIRLVCHFLMDFWSRLVCGL